MTGVADRRDDVQRMASAAVAEGGRRFDQLDLLMQAILRWRDLRTAGAQRHRPAADDQRVCGCRQGVLRRQGAGPGQRGARPYRPDAEARGPRRRPGGRCLTSRASSAASSEFFAPLSRGAEAPSRVHDDAAVLVAAPGRDLVVTTDTLVAGVHFLEDDPPA